MEKGYMRYKELQGGGRILINIINVYLTIVISTQKHTQIRPRQKESLLERDPYLMDLWIGYVAEPHYGLEPGTGKLLWISAIFLPFLLANIISYGLLYSSLLELAFSAPLCTKKKLVTSFTIYKNWADKNG